MSSVRQIAVLLCLSAVSSFDVNPSTTTRAAQQFTPPMLWMSSSSTDAPASAAPPKEEPPIDYDIPEDAVLTLKPNAMKRLRELRDKQPNQALVLRMGVRSGGCSGMSYVMDFSTEDAIQEDDEIDEYTGENIKCVVDAKSMLYLYGLELDYSDELIGGGFKVCYYF